MNRRSSRFWLMVYCTLGAFLCGLGLSRGSGSITLTEGMVAEAGENMWKTGEWVVPWMYGEPYTYKPPLAYWLAATSYAASGGSPTETALRVPFALSGWLMGLAIAWLIGSATDPRTGALAGLASIGGAAFLQKVSLATFDVLVAAGVGVAVAGACVALASDEERPRAWYLAYGGLAFAFLAKGPIAVLVFAPGLLAAALMLGRFRRLLGRHHVAAGVCFVSLSVAYLALLWWSLGDGGFAQPLEEAQRRGLAWTWSDTRQTLLKPIMILGALLPWSLLLPAGAKAGLSAATGERSSYLVLRAATVFLIAGILAFMAVPTHEMRYYLPLAGPAGIVAGVVAASFLDGKFRRWVWGAAWGLALLLAVVSSGLAFRGELGLVPRLALVGAAFFGLWSASRNWATRSVVASLVVASLIFTVVEIAVVAPQKTAKRSPLGLVGTLDARISETETLWVRGPADYSAKHASLFFYLHREVRAFRSPAEVPPGALYLFAERPSGLEPFAEQEPNAGFDLEVLTEIDHPRYSYTLARVR